MAEIIYLNADGSEMKRVVKGKGRGPHGATKGADGNWTVPFQVDAVNPAEPKAVVDYITLDVNGKEIVADLKDKSGTAVSRLVKGRGANKPGYTLQTDGEFKGHWTKTIVPEPVVTEVKAETIVTAEKPVAETPAAV